MCRVIGPASVPDSGVWRLDREPQHDLGGKAGNHFVLSKAQRHCHFLALGAWASVLSGTIALRHPQCGLPYSALRAPLEMCELAVGKCSTPLGRKISRPVALTLIQQAGAFPPGPHRVSKTVSLQRALGSHDGPPSLVWGAGWGAGVFDQLPECRGFLWAV